MMDVLHKIGYKKSLRVHKALFILNLHKGRKSFFSLSLQTAHNLFVHSAHCNNIYYYIDRKMFLASGYSHNVTIERKKVLVKNEMCETATADLSS